MKVTDIAYLDWVVSFKISPLVAALGGFSSFGAWVLGFVGSVLAAPRLSRCGVRA